MLDILQKRIDSIREEKYKEESEEDLDFYINYLLSPNDSGSDESGKIILTIDHHGNMLSRVIFPKSSHFEYLSIEEEMDYLYNATM